MNWIKLESEGQLNDILQASRERDILIFKHSTRCSISSTALNRLERNWRQEEMMGTQPYYLDLIANRNISNQVAERFGVEHQSPQVLIVRNGEAVHDWSHLEIDFSSIKAVVSASEHSGTS